MPNDFDLLWKNCLLLLKEKFDNLFFESFFIDTYINSVNGGFVYIVVDGEIAKQNLDSVSSSVNDVLGQVFQSNFKAKFVTNDEIAGNNLHNIVESEDDFFETNLREDYIFDNFIVGLSNKESYQAALSVSSTPGKLFNPLFIHGKSGLGKTHLIHSIGNRLVEQKPNMRVLYVTSDQFVEDFMKLVKSNSAKDNEWFNHKYRDIDVLLVDDVQFLSNKDKTNEMFFNVYNDLFSKNKQIVLTSDVMPKELHGLEERLVSRFTQGLSVPIYQPEFETSLKILNKKLSYFSEMENSLITNEALSYIARNFSKDVRDLEGALNRIIFYTISFTDSQEITMEIVHEAFKDYKSSKIAGEITEKEIIKTVCSYYNLSKSNLISKSRQKLIAVPRHVCIYLIRTVLNTPFEKIGKFMGNRDHSTVMSSYHKVNEQIEKNNQEYISVINELTNMLKK